MQTSIDNLLRAICSTEILIKGGTVVNSHHEEDADVYIENGEICEVGPHIIKAGCDVRVIQAGGKYVMPGGIDPHTHISMELSGTVSVDDYLSAHSAALAGGTTMNIESVMPTNGSYIEGMKTYFKNAEVAVMDYGFHAHIIFWNENVADEMEVMVKQYGINSFKFFQALDFEIRDDEWIQEVQVTGCYSYGTCRKWRCCNLWPEKNDRARHYCVKGHPLSRPPFVYRDGNGAGSGRLVVLPYPIRLETYQNHTRTITARVWKTQNHSHPRRISV
uniref:dihydropyrimidinase n=1 Tax=Kalanchoe fedtschenkoi TaxID=63787 RepID=A0A7N0VDD1_KALFE